MISYKLKPFLSDKLVAKNKIYFIENGELIKMDLESAEILNDFFSDIVKNLDITRYSNNKPFLDNINYSTMKAILKYSNYPRIVAIRNKCKSRAIFNFSNTIFEYY